MQRQPNFRITDDDIEELRDHTRDEAWIATWVHWTTLTDQLDAVINQVSAAFAGQQLGDGIGLFEAQAMDDYASPEELAQARQCDERNDWRRISADALNQCYAAPSYMDATGCVFHLPALLIAELNDEFGYGFIDRLIDARRNLVDWLSLLTTPQREAIAAALRLVAEHPIYSESEDEIDTAIARILAESRAP